MDLLLHVRTLRLGLRNVRQHKLRSGLTVLGIVFGVCSVISMLAIGEGAAREAQEQIRRLGSQNIIVRAVKPPEDSTAGRRGSERSPRALEYGLRYADAERLHDTIPSVEVLVPIKARTDDARFEDRAVQATTLGTVPWYPESAALELRAGRFLCDLDMTSLAAVCVIGEGLARRLFLFRDPLGQTLRIGRRAWRVVGVVADARGGRSGGGGEALPSQAADIFVPLTSLRAFEGDIFFKVSQNSQESEYVELHQIIVGVRSLEDVIPTADLIEKTLARDRKNKDYELIVPLRELEAARRTQRIFSIVLGSIAAISLLVGGIGIMNIMLASVSERTREIGIRRALGARRADILFQFLVECVILSAGGGAIGMLLGAAIPSAVTSFSGMPTVLTPGPFILAFVVSAVIGVVFGIYPARRAAIMDPIEALRHE